MLGAEVSKSGEQWSEERLPSKALAQIVASVVSGKITNDSGKTLLSRVFNGDPREIETIVLEENMLSQDIADEEYDAVAQELTEANVDMVKAIKEKGQQGKIMWFVGQMMREMVKRNGRGGANAEKSKTAVLKALDVQPDTGSTKRKEKGVLI